MTKFMKLLLTLIFILIIEIIIIYLGYSKKAIFKTYGIENYDPKKGIVIMVNLPDNTLSIFQEDNLLKTYEVSSGKPSTPSPTGIWKIVSKGPWDKGFGGYWMGLNAPWGKFGIHGTTHPESIGTSTSQGCIRMRNNEVAKLYKIVHIGTPVIIWGGPYGNFGSYLRTLRPGDRGADVYEVQRILINRGYYSSNPDGIYGEGMKAAIHRYQKDSDLPLSNDIDIRVYNALGVYLVD